MTPSRVATATNNEYAAITGSARRNHAALSLAHRWFAFLESSAGNVDDHLDIFTDDVRLTGHRGTVHFAQGHQQLKRWFSAIPDDISAHRIVHSSWTEMTADSGSLGFLVAYQTPGRDGDVSGSLISYQTVVSFAYGSPRFVSLDKTPILPNTRHDYSPTMAEHRVAAFIHAVLSGQHVHSAATAALQTISTDIAVLDVDVRIPVPERTSAYDAFVTVVTDEATFHAGAWSFSDDGDATFPEPVNITPLQRISAL